MEIIDGRLNAPEIDVGPDARAHDVLVAIYRNPRMSLHTRMRAAIAAIPFESPKLQATATVQLGLDFAARLERAMLRSDGVRLVASAPASFNAPVFKRRF
jgi:hypothetical protein